MSWLRDAILDASGQTNEAAGGQAEDGTEPVVQVSGKGAAAQATIMAQDRDAAQAFVDKWRPRVDRAQPTPVTGRCST